MACHELGPGSILDGVAAGGVLRVVGCVGREHDHKRLGAHKIRECPGSMRVVRRAVLGQVVHLRAWRRTRCLNACLHTRAEMRSLSDQLVVVLVLVPMVV